MMKKTCVIRLWAPVLLLSGAALTASTIHAEAQDHQLVTTDSSSSMQATASVPQASTPVPSASSSVIQSLLDKAHAFEARGRMDMAAQTWQQVLLTDPNNPEALGGLARAAKLQGNTALSNTYLERLRAVSPNDPNIARVENMGAQQNQMAQLQQAGKLAETGQYAAAMAIYRQVFGANPPPGDWSLAYYETESATEDGRAHSISGLSALVEKYPNDTRYQIALGRILTYNPKTRELGRKYLERYPKDQQANEALRQSLLWDSANPAMASQIRAYLATHRDPQLAEAFQAAGGTPGKMSASVPATAARTPSRVPSAAVSAGRARSAAEVAAYKALNAKHIDEAETRFKAILTSDSENAKALAGMGYVRMEQGNFSGAISFLEQAKHDSPGGSSADKGLDAALDTARFWLIMGEGQRALSDGDLTAAEKQYRAALMLRPANPEALAGLGGTMLKAQQPAAAVPLFAKYVAARPNDPEGWRGLFTAQYQAGNAPLALATERQIPAAVHTQLLKDPVFLRALASVYSAVGRDGDAQKTLESALALPFPADAKDAKADAQMQYAGILLAANHLDQSAALYRQLLAEDHGNTSAWQGLVRVEHAMGHDSEAVQTVESMPPATYEAAMKDAGFETTVASIYQAENKLDVAQGLLEKALAQQTTAGQKPSVAVEMQLAGIYLQNGNAQLAYPIFQRVLTDDPTRADAWAGLLSVLHNTGHDKEALAQVQLIAPAVRVQLETNIGYLQTMASIYGGFGQSREATLFLNRVEQYYAAQHTAPPADVEIQNAWLLYNGVDDAGLYRQLMSLGGRPDLTENQRRTVQTIWSNWAVRRANQATAAGNPQRALAILNAAARAFPDNPAVIKALANGYARAGQPAEAVSIYRAQNMASASVADYEAAVDASLAAGDNSDAERWLRFALVAYPADPRILILAAKFEQSRGDTTRAIDYYHRSLSAMPPADPGAELATELSLPAPTASVSLPSANQAQDLSTLLAPDAGPGVQGQPYLPSYGNVYGQPPVVPGSPPYYGPPGTVPAYMTNPGAHPGGSGGSKNYVQPQSRVEKQAANLPSQAEVELTVRGAIARVLEQADGSAVADLAASEPKPVAAASSTGTVIAEVSTPQSYQQQQVVRLTQQAATQAPPSVTVASGNTYAPFVPYVAPAPTAPAAAAVGNADSRFDRPGVIAVQLGDNTPHPAAPVTELTDVIPTGHYIPNARGNNPISLHPDIAAAQAASIRRQQSDTARTGQSNPPAEIFSTTENTAYTSQPQGQGGQQVGQPSALLTGQVGPVSDSGDQQYPQPHTAAPASRSSTARRVVRRAPPVAASAPAAEDAQAPTATSTATVEPAPVPPTAATSAGMNYPAVGPSLSGQPYPLIGPPFPLGTPPSDAELEARNLPPLRGGGYNPQAPLPMTPRQQAENELASLEGSYSGWVGGTGIGRYRSGIPGLDRLYDIEAPLEASAMLGRSVRLTAVALPVFLESGSLNPSTFAVYSPNTVPYLGTLPANAANPPAQQLSNGIGGELQFAMKNLNLAAGYTPYEFLVRNITGRANWRPVGGHFTLFGDRGSVKDTQLSYAGLRDPGTITPTNAGTIWGGVIATTGGMRMDFGSGGSGFYLTGDGGVLKGEHVLTNTKFEGGTGAYFRVKSWPGYGGLTVGGMLFGMHYEHNELGMTYGQGGYFSPNDYFLASVPVTFNGYHGANFHYVISGGLGVQTFQQASAAFYPLNPALQASVQTSLGCTLAQTAAHTCGQYPVSGNTGFNYVINSEVSYLFGEHWYLGGFLSGNNTNNYNTVSGGFFFRYTFRKQHSTEGYPTGLFPVDGFRPLRVP